MILNQAERHCKKELIVRTRLAVVLIPFSGIGAYRSPEQNRMLQTFLMLMDGAHEGAGKEPGAKS